MKTPNQDKLEYWRNHLEQSKLYPDGIQAYCEANQLAPSAYFKKSKIAIFTGGSYFDRHKKEK